MGIADIIPGVSGGTMALILGIYPRLIEAISNINLSWPVSWLRMWFIRDKEGGNQARVKFEQNFWRMDPVFLLTVAGGILFAVAAGSLVITHFLDNYPVLVRAFFFGLILSSSLIPYRRVRKNLAPGIKNIIGVLFVGIVTFGLAFVVTAPEMGFNPPVRWTEVTSRGEELSRLSARAMSAYPQSELLASPKNDNISVDGGEVPAGQKVFIPRLPAWYLFISAVVAICAMILPGISGAYILLILGAYYYLLNIFNHFQIAVAGGSIALKPLGYLLLFCTGAGVGLLIFSRVIRFVLHRWPAVTMAGLTGLMLGGLRGLWRKEFVANSSPGVAVVFLAGIIIVSLLDYAGRLQNRESADG